MSTLDALLSQAVNSGLRGLTLYPTQDGEWQAATTPDRQSWTVTIDADPAVALRKALGAPAASVLPTDNDDAGDIFS